ncbi:acetate--CoA ligase family protein [Rhabdothermincola sp.]|uniref:acetate--CoA ligase family protein n=1 Tax=Rhabdothermincola sp. TaxID=2820405 RepID=UPI002FE1EA63
MTAPRTDVTGRPTALRQIDLDTFFRPRTVAVIGASDSTGRPNSAMWRKIRQWAEQAGAECYPVNPNRDEVDGVPCYRSVLDIPGDLDLAAILVGNAVEMFETVLEKKPRFAVIFAAGFNEVGPEGEALQRRLEELIATGSTHVLGPNTNLNAFETFRDLPPPKIALITQSGHQGRPVFQAQEQGIALSHWAPTGNEADLEFADFAAYFADQPEVGVIAAYVEGFKDGRTLMLAADHAATAGKPIVAVKVGRTDEGRSMAKSHTGHLTGSDAVVSAVFRQYGITRVDGLDELTDVAATLARTKPPAQPGRRNVCIYAISGGTGAHMADLVAAAGLELAELTPASQQALRQWIPGYLRVSNPVDSGGAPSADERGPKIVQTILDDPNIDMLICPITGALASMSRPMAQSLVDAAAHTDKPILVVWGSPDSTDPVYTEVLLGSRLPVFRTFHNCVLAARAYFDHHDFLARHRSPFAKPVTRRSPAGAGTDHLLSAGRPLSEHESKALLAAYGIPVTRDVLATSAAQAVRAARDIGFPVVLKVSSPDLPHKSDLGLVRVGLHTAAEVQRAFAELEATARKANRKATIDGVLVSELVSGGVETVVGISQDELFGPVIMFGLGGVFVEVFEDVTFRVPPFDKDEARRMVQEIKGYKLLQGTRGRKPSDVRALVDVIMKVQRLALDHAGTLAELDINPLVVRPKGQGVVALDALAIPRSTPQPTP